MTNQQKLKKLFARLDEIDAYGRSIGKLSFDMECCAPEEGIARAGEDMAVLGKQIHKLTHDKRFEALIEELLRLDNPYHCPHGRPTMIVFSQSDMDRKFKRIVT